MTLPDHGPSRVACRTVLREAFGPTGALSADLQAHVGSCAFCAARLRARDRLVPFLRRRPGLPGGVVEAHRVQEGIFARIVEHAEQEPLGHLLAGAVPAATPSAATAWPESLLESELAQRAFRAPPTIGATSWARVKDSILDEVAVGQRRQHRRWWIGLLGTAVAAGVALVVVTQERPVSPSITFQDITSLPGGTSAPSIDFAVVRRGANR